MNNNIKYPFILPSLTLLLLIAILLNGCDNTLPVSEQIDLNLEQQLLEASDGLGASSFLLPNSSDLASIPQDPKNPLTTEKVYLGMMLFHETAMAANPVKAEGFGTYSCSSCHPANAGFASGNKQGIGEGGFGFGTAGETRTQNPNYREDQLDVQPLRAPRTVNVAFQKNLLWGGRFGAMAANFGTERLWSADSLIEENFRGFEGAETQALAGQKLHRMNIEKSSIPTNPEYKAMFDRVFAYLPPNERITRITAALAISAYVRSIVSDRAPFQRWLRGEKSAMTEQEKRGALLFFGKARCYTCHNGPALSSQTFYAVGFGDFNFDEPNVFNNGTFTENDPAFLGRGGFTGYEQDNFKFKTPQLYNLTDAPFYGHGSSFGSVREVVEYFNKGIKQNSKVPDTQIAATFQPLGLSQSEVNDLVIFIEKGLYDPELIRYFPSYTPSGNCFPNNDTKSRSDMNCN